MWDNARRYDLEMAESMDDLPFWEWALDEYRPSKVLELASGTGRLLIPLAKKGTDRLSAFRIYGVDNSASFLECAYRKVTQCSTQLQNSIRCIEADMQSFQISTTFDLVLVTANALSILSSIEEQISCLVAIRNHLSPEGRVAIDLFTPSYGQLLESQFGEPRFRVVMDTSLPDKEIDRFQLKLAERYTPETQTISRISHSDIDYQDGSTERFTDEIDYQVIFPRELQLLVRMAGLKVLERFGDYNREPYDSQSKRYLWILGRA